MHFHNSYENYHIKKRKGHDVLFCDPSGGLATLAIVTTIAGGVTAAYGQTQQAKSQSDAYRYSAGLLDTQAKLAKRTADINSRLVQDAASRESAQLGRNVSETMGAQKAASAANMGGGSVTAADIMTDTLKKARMDELAIKYGADIKSWGIREEEKAETWRLGVERDQYLKAAKNARKAGNIAVASSILGTATQIADVGMKYRYSPKLYNTK